VIRGSLLCVAVTLLTMGWFSWKFLAVAGLLLTLALVDSVSRSGS
jgi:hypothetical protein